MMNWWEIPPVAERSVDERNHPLTLARVEVSRNRRKDVDDESMIRATCVANVAVSTSERAVESCSFLVLGLQRSTWK